MSGSIHTNESNNKNTSFASWTNVNMSKAENIAITTGYVVLFLVAVLGNAFVIHVARKLLPTRGPFNLLVINMAACDILYAMTVVPIQFHYQYIGFLWLSGGFGTFLCKFSQFVLLFAIDSSILTLTVITVERYLAIVPTIKTTMTRKNALKVILAVVGFSCLHSTTELFKMTTIPHDYQNTTVTYCHTKWSDDRDLAHKLYKAEMVTKFILNYVLPVIIMVTLYYSIIRFLWLREIPGNKTEHNEMQKRKQLRKVILMLVAMVTTFVITWIAAHVVHFYWAFDNNSSLSRYQVQTLFWLAHTNCATNPCFYLIFNKEYRDEFRRIGQRLKSCWRCQTPNTIAP